MMVSLIDFANERGIRPNTISKYLSNHPEYAQHTVKNTKDKRLYLDAKAVEMLSEFYPMPTQPIAIIQDDEARAELDKQKETIIKLMSENEMLREQVEQITVGKQALLEAKISFEKEVKYHEKENKRLTTELEESKSVIESNTRDLIEKDHIIDTKEKEISDKSSIIEEKEKELEEKEKELEEERNKYKKVFGIFYRKIKE